MENNMMVYPWDSIPHFSPKWNEISGKAEHYKTAYRRSDGLCLQIVGLARYADGCKLVEPAFKVRDEFGLCIMTADQLCGFCL